MAELKPLWDEYNKLRASGARNARAIMLEGLIHGRQREIGSEPYDFDKMWDKIEKDRTPSIEVPTIGGMIKPETETVPQSRFTFEQAKKLIGENDCAILDDCAKWAEVRMVYLSHVLNEINPAENTNVARRGQGINIGLGEFVRRKSIG